MANLADRYKAFQIRMRLAEAMGHKHHAAYITVRIRDYRAKIAEQMQRENLKVLMATAGK